MTVEGNAPCFPQRVSRGLLFQVVDVFFQVVLFWNVTLRNVASWLIDFLVV